jgi:hypothetical protein
MRPFAMRIARSTLFAAVAALPVLLPTDVGARGESCDINLPNGLKEPGKDDGNGNCCSAFNSSKCTKLTKEKSSKQDSPKQDSPKKDPPKAEGKPPSNGKSCDINLPNGLKEPGKEDGNGNCCSVFGSKKCVKLPRGK